MYNWSDSVGRGALQQPLSLKKALEHNRVQLEHVSDETSQLTTCTCRVSSILKVGLFLCVLLGATSGLIVWFVSHGGGQAMDITNHVIHNSTKENRQHSQIQFQVDTLGNHHKNNTKKNQQLYRKDSSDSYRSGKLLLQSFIENDEDEWEFNQKVTNQEKILSDQQFLINAKKETTTVEESTGSFFDLSPEFSFSGDGTDDMEIKDIGAEEDVDEEEEEDVDEEEENADDDFSLINHQGLIYGEGISANMSEEISPTIAQIEETSKNEVQQTSWLHSLDSIHSKWDQTTPVKPTQYSLDTSTVKEAQFFGTKLLIDSSMSDSMILDTSTSSTPRYPVEVGTPSVIVSTPVAIQHTTQSTSHLATSSLNSQIISSIQKNRDVFPSDSQSFYILDEKPVIQTSNGQSHDLEFKLNITRTSDHFEIFGGATSYIGHITPVYVPSLAAMTHLVSTTISKSGGEVNKQHTDFNFRIDKEMGDVDHQTNKEGEDINHRIKIESGNADQITVIAGQHINYRTEKEGRDIEHRNRKYVGNVDDGTNIKGADFDPKTNKDIDIDHESIKETGHEGGVFNNNENKEITHVNYKTYNQTGDEGQTTNKQLKHIKLKTNKHVLDIQYGPNNTDEDLGHITNIASEDFNHGIHKEIGDADYTPNNCKNDGDVDLCTNRESENIDLKTDKKVNKNYKEGKYDFLILH